MKSKKICSFIIVSGAAFLAGSAAAQSAGGWDSSFNKRFYIGAGGGSSSLSPDTDGSVFTVQDDSDKGGAGYFGVDLTRRLSVELLYTDMGRAGLVDDAAVPSEISYAETSLSGLYYLWNGLADVEYQDYDGLDLRSGISVYGRVGAGKMENEAFGTVDYTRANDVQLLVGLGVEYGFENGLGARAEYIRYDTDAEFSGLSLLYRFGAGKDVSPPLEPELPVLPAPSPISILPPPPPPPPPLPGDLPTLPGSNDIGEDVSMSEVDQDADGIENSVDLCPDTIVGTPVDSTGCDMFNGVIEGVNFLSGSDTLTEVARSELDEVVATLNAFSDIRLSVEAHTDSRGLEDANLDLSRLRALAVVRYLIAQGIDINRLQARAYGESRPIADNSTSDGRLLNRRVEFRTL